MRTLINSLGIICTILTGAEISTRIDEWIRYDVPILANPNRDRDLVLTESWGSRGRPYGRYRKWSLDANGFRTISIPFDAQSRVPCLVILGASESFGLYESPEKEYPAQLAQLLNQAYPVRVINAAIAGITLKSLIVYWNHWIKTFQPNEVIIYPSPQFYLDNEPPRLSEQSDHFAPESSLVKYSPRLFGRVRDLYHQLPVWAKRYREEWVIEDATKGKDPSWFFRDVPEERLNQFENDLRELVGRIKQCGAKPILLTHARSANSLLDPTAQGQLRAMRMFFPRATPQTLLRFEEGANERIRRLAADSQIQLIDVDQALSGRKDLFADLFHFNDEGASKMADLIAKQLLPLSDSSCQK